MEGKELRNWRDKYNLTQSELAEHLHVKRETVTRWEIGMRTIPPFLFLALEALENRFMKGGGSKAKTRERKPKRKEVKKHGKPLSKR